MVTSLYNNSRVVTSLGQFDPKGIITIFGLIKF